MGTRKNSDLSRETILSAGLELAERKGYRQVSRADLADAANMSAANVSFHFGTMKQFQHALMRAAVHGRHLRVIAQGLAVRDKEALKAPAELQDAAVNAIKG